MKNNINKACYVLGGKYSKYIKALAKYPKK